MIMAKVILVEDEQALRRSMRRRLEVDDHLVFETQSVPVAVSLVREHAPEVVVTDINLGPESGIDLVHQLRDLGYRGGIIVITAYGTIENAVEAVRNGADEFLQKPLSLEEVMLAINRTIERRRMANRLNLYERVDQVADLQEAMVGKSEVWAETVDLAERTAEASARSASGLAAILLLGETGTGKETMARFIHRQSAEKSGPFVHIRCYALPAKVIERELFGSSGGETFGSGLFDLARGGSIFLDEITEMPMPLQSRLLALLVQREEESERPENGIETASIRLIASSSHDLSKKIEGGTFRQDLFFRLNMFAISLPRLRDRGDDVVLMAKHFLAMHGGESGRTGLAFSPNALAALRFHSWPGNVRELRNSVERAALLCNESTISAEDLAIPADVKAKGNEEEVPGRATNKMVTVTNPQRTRFEFSTGPIKLDMLEKELIKAAIRQTGGNISKAAKLVGMTRSGLRYRIERHDLRHLIEEMAT